MKSTYDPMDYDPVTYCDAPENGTWRIMVSALDRDTIALRVQGESNFMSSHHARLLWKQLGAALSETAEDGVGKESASSVPVSQSEEQ